MQITIELPEEIGQQLQQQWGNLSRKMLESLAVEAYRNGVLTEAQIQVLLNLPSRFVTEAFLKQSQAYLDYTEEDLEQDLQTLRHLLPEGLSFLTPRLCVIGFGLERLKFFLNCSVKFSFRGRSHKNSTPRAHQGRLFIGLSNLLIG
ncbi:UPF0175 family protein [Candidatus Gracilibacteria bacterium]|nr:UPF0175 family protein [Candidatus Gracilibacteria bacterium]